MVGKLTSDTMLSCSRLPAILGLSPYSTPNQELNKTVRALAGEPPEPWAGAEAADWGNTFEPLILREMCMRLSLDLVEPTAPFKRKGIPLAASIDGLGIMPIAEVARTYTTDPARGIYVVGGRSITVSGDAVLESKLTGQAPEREGDDDAPPPHRGPVQLQGCMICSNLKWGAVGVLYRGTQLRIYIYGADQLMHAQIIEACEDFERRKLGPDWYAPKSGLDAAKTWSRADEDAPPVILPHELLPVVEGIIHAQASKKAIEAALDKCNAALMEALCNHTEGHITGADGRVITVRWPMRSYKAQPEKIVPAKPAYQIRQSTVSIK